MYIFVFAVSLAYLREMCNQFSPGTWHELTKHFFMSSGTIEDMTKMNWKCTWIEKQEEYGVSDKNNLNWN